MNLDFNAISALATAIAVLVAILAIWAENRRSRFSQGVDLLFRLSDIFFYSSEFKNNRKKASGFLKKYWGTQQINNKGKSKENSKMYQSLELDAILDFIEGIALMTRKGALDKELTWNFFTYWVISYCKLSQGYIAYWRQSTPDAWGDVDWLNNLFVKIYKKNFKHGYTNPTLEDLDLFLDDEIHLSIKQ